MPRLLPVLAAALAVTALSAARAADTPAGDFRLEIVGVDAAAFPEVALRFRVLGTDGAPARSLPPGEVVVLEDGREAHRFRPARLKDVPAGVALALDTSGSMAYRGKMEAARDAALRFANRLDPATPCGLVLFHHAVHGLVPPGTDRGPLAEKAREAEAAGGTALRDAVLAALDLLPAAEGDQRQAVVLLTDGWDVNSRHGLDEVIAAAQARKAAVFVVGLGEPGANPPVRTVLVLDKSGSMREEGKMAALKRAAARFVELLPADGADTTLLPFDTHVQPPGAFTNDRAALLRDIRALRPDGGTALYDATWLAVATLHADRQAARAGNAAEVATRRSVIALTDGVDEGSREHRPEDVVELAREAGVRVFMLGMGREKLDEATMRGMAEGTRGQYFAVPDAARLTEVFEHLSLQLHNDGADAPSRIDEASLVRLARATGGDYYPLRDADRLGEVFERVAAAVETTHTVRYRSRRDRSDGTARGIELRLGGLAATTSYATFGLLTPASSPPLFLAGLAVLGGLLGLPALFGRRKTGD